MKLLALFAAALAAAAPAPPKVAGPRSTTSTRPVYTFSARGAIGFRCAFDSTVLHTCARRYSERLEPGMHVLRVRAVGRAHKLSKLSVVKVQVRLAVPELKVGAPISVGAGAGVPAVGPNAVWVPITGDGTLARVDSFANAVVARIRVGPTSSGPGDLDSAILAGRAVWAASDAGGTITRIDTATNAVTATLSLTPRPGGLATCEFAIWAFHFLQPTVTRIDVSTNAVQTFTVPGLAGTGIAPACDSNSLWLLSTQPSRVLRVNATTGAVLQTISLQPPFARTRTVVDTWSLAYADNGLWATLPNYGALARVDTVTGTVTYMRLAYGSPFGVAVGGGSTWVATDRAVWQLDETTGAPRAASLVPAAGGFGFVSIAFQYGAAWLTTYDRGTVTRVESPPPAPPRPAAASSRAARSPRS